MRRSLALLASASRVGGSGGNSISISIRSGGGAHRRAMMATSSSSSSSTSRMPFPSSSRASASSYNGVPGRAESIRSRVKQMDADWRVNGWHVLRWMAFIAGSGVGTAAFIYRDEITEWLGYSGAKITATTLGHEDVQIQAKEIARGVVYELLNDRHALQLTTQFLNDLLARDETRAAVLELLRTLLALEGTQILLSDLFVRVFADEHFLNAAANLASHLIQREETKDAVVSLLQSLYNDPATQEMTSHFFYAQAMAAVNATLASPEVKKQAVDFVDGVLGEPDVQHGAGDAIWGALRSTFIPGFLGGGRSSSKEKNLRPSSKSDPGPEVFYDSGDSALPPSSDIAKSSKLETETSEVSSVAQEEIETAGMPLAEETSSNLNESDDAENSQSTAAIPPIPAETMTLGEADVDIEPPASSSRDIIDSDDDHDDDVDKREESGTDDMDSRKENEAMSEDTSGKNEAAEETTVNKGA